MTQAMCSLSGSVAKSQNPTELKMFSQINRRLVFLALVFATFGLVQIIVNIHLNYQLAMARQDINFLQSNCQQNSPNPIQEHEEVQKDEIDSFVYDNIYKYKQEDNGNYSFEIDSTLISRDGLLMEMDEHSSEHAIVRRSSNSRRSNRRRNMNTVRRNLRQLKGIGIHVEANQASTPSVPGVPGPSYRPSPGQTIRDWSMPSENSRKFFGVNHLKSDGYITVPVDGLYFLYSQVIFTHNTHITMAAEIGVGEAGLATFNKCVLGNQLTQPNQFTACHTNGVKYLEAGSRIALIVHPPGVTVRMSPKYTYFGAFLIGL